MGGVYILANKFTYRMESIFCSSTLKEDQKFFLSNPNTQFSVYISVVKYRGNTAGLIGLPSSVLCMGKRFASISISSWTFNFCSCLGNIRAGNS